MRQEVNCRYKAIWGRILSLMAILQLFFSNGKPAWALQHQARLAKVVGNRDWCISFRWGGDMNECACVLAASAGLVRLCDAVAYYPDDDLTYDLNHLLEDFRACV